MNFCLEGVTVEGHGVGVRALGAGTAVGGAAGGLAQGLAVPPRGGESGGAAERGRGRARGHGLMKSGRERRRRPSRKGRRRATRTRPAARMRSPRTTTGQRSEWELTWFGEIPFPLLLDREVSGTCLRLVKLKFLSRCCLHALPGRLFCLSFSPSLYTVYRTLISAQVPL